MPWEDDDEDFEEHRERKEKPEPQKQKFLSPTMDIGQLITLGGIVASIIGGYYSFDARLNLIERQIGRQTQVIELSIRQDEQLKYLLDRVGKIEEHVDKIARAGPLQTPPR